MKSADMAVIKYRYHARCRSKEVKASAISNAIPIAQDKSLQCKRGCGATAAG